ncbi:unnamed protein product [Camellia sinensis]
MDKNPLEMEVGNVNSKHLVLALKLFFALKYVADAACIVLRVYQEGLHYNPYFPGGAIAMPKMLIDGAVEYEDGTLATESQMGKDVVTFLSWAAEPEMEERKLMGFKWIFVLSLALLQAAYYRRMRWSVLKSQLIIVVVGGGENKSGAAVCVQVKSSWPYAYTTKMFQLLLAAYSTISIQDASLFLGMNEDDATNCM